MNVSQEVATWARKVREATLRRDDAIRRMHADGATLRAIGEAADLSHTAIAKILQRPINDVLNDLMPARPVGGGHDR